MIGPCARAVRAHKTRPAPLVRVCAAEGPACRREDKPTAAPGSSSSRLLRRSPARRASLAGECDPRHSQGRLHGASLLLRAARGLPSLEAGEEEIFSGWRLRSVTDVT